MADETETTPSFVTIDESRLDQEWLRQPALFHKYARKLADAKADLAEADVALDVVRAELSNNIRNDPAKFGLSKITDKVVETAILAQKGYLQALRELNRHKHRVDVYQAAVSALDHRKRALENLVTLHGQDYFATPRLSKKAAEATQDGFKRKLRDTAFAPKDRNDD
jgi:hypothetical protein